MNNVLCSPCQPPPTIVSFEHNGARCVPAPPPSLLLSLQGHFYSAFIAWSALRSEVRQEVGDVIPGMSVQTSSQTLLVKIMGDQADASSQNEETVKNAHLQVIFGLFWTKGAAVAHKIDKADSNAAVNVENEVVLLGCCHGFNCNGIFEHFAAWEALLDKFFDKLYTKIGVIARLDLVANTRD